MNLPFARFLSGVGATGFGQLVTTGIQLVSLPAFLLAWDVRTYGQWMLLSALPAPFAMADMGMNTVAGTKMSTEVIRGNWAAVNVVFQSALVFTLCAMLGCGAIGGCVLWVWTWQPLSEPGSRAALSLLLANLLLVVFCGLFEAIFRACGKFALGIYLLNCARLVEWGGSLLGAVATRTVLGAACGMCIGRLISTVILYTVARLSFPEISWGGRHARMAEIGKMIRPAFAYMTIVGGSLFSIQGFTVIVGRLAGPSELAIFTSYRTIARIVVQCAALLARPLLPEASRKHALGDYKGLAKIYVIGTLLTTLAAVLGVIAIYFAGPALIRFWSAGKLPFVRSIFSLLLCYGVLAATWQVALFTLTGTNQHTGFAFRYLAISLVALTVAYIAGAHQGIIAIVIVLVVSEALVSLSGVIACWPYYGRSFIELSMGKGD